MKRTFLAVSAILLGSLGINAQNEVLKIAHGQYTDYALLSDIDSLSFSADGTQLIIQPLDTLPAVAILRSDITRMEYIAQDDCPSKVKIAYDGSTVTVHNPHLLHGVSVSMDGAYVTVTNTNTTAEYTTKLSGSTSNGAFTYIGTYKTTIELDGVTITSQKGAALDIQCGKRVNLEVIKETENTLCDAASGSQKAALYCKGHLEIDKSGTLNVTGKTAHAISAKEYLKLKKSDGTINILGAVKDGIHCKQYFLGNGFTVNVNNVGDEAIQAELDTDDNATASTTFDDIVNGSLIINNGTYSLTVSAGTNVPAYGPGGGGPGGGGGGWPGGGGGGGTTTQKRKGLNADGPVELNGGNVNILTTVNGAEGIQGSKVTINGGNHYLKCYDDCISSDGIINFAGGNTVCYATNNDAVDSNYGRSGAITISGGNVFAYSCAGSPEEGFDCDNNSYITITGGIAVSAGGTQGGGGGWGGSSSTQSVGSSTQGYYLGSSPTSYATGKYYTLYNTSGEAICTYRFDGSCSNSLSLLTAPNLGKGSITVKSGTTAPTESASQVCNASSQPVFFIAPTVTATTTVATVTSK